MKARMTLLCTMLVSAILFARGVTGCASANGGDGGRDAGAGAPGAPKLEGTRWNAVEIGAQPAEVTQAGFTLAGGRQDRSGSRRRRGRRPRRSTSVPG